MNRGPPLASPRLAGAVAWILAAAFYVTLTVVQTWPLVTQLSAVLPHDLGDPGLNAWIIWWNAQAVPLTERWWNAPIFFPSSGALAFSETLLGLLPITTPIQWFGGSPITAYNVAFLLTFPLSALAAHALVSRLTGRHDAAVIAGLVYGFNPFRIAHFPQIQVMTSYWMPLSLLGSSCLRDQREGAMAGALRRGVADAGALERVLPAVFSRAHRLVARLVRAVASLRAASAGHRRRVDRRVAAARSAACGDTAASTRRSAFSAGSARSTSSGPTCRRSSTPRRCSSSGTSNGFTSPRASCFPASRRSRWSLLLLIHWLWTSKPETRVPRTCRRVAAGRRHLHRRSR